MKPHPFNTNGAFRLATEARRTHADYARKGNIASHANRHGKRADALLRKFD